MSILATRALTSEEKTTLGYLLHFSLRLPCQVINTEEIIGKPVEWDEEREPSSSEVITFYPLSDSERYTTERKLQEYEMARARYLRSQMQMDTELKDFFIPQATTFLKEKGHQERIDKRIICEDKGKKIVFYLRNILNGKMDDADRIYVLIDFLAETLTLSFLGTLYKKSLAIDMVFATMLKLYLIEQIALTNPETVYSSAFDWIMSKDWWKWSGEGKDIAQAAGAHLYKHCDNVPRWITRHYINHQHSDIIPRWIQRYINTREICHSYYETLSNSFPSRYPLEDKELFNSIETVLWQNFSFSQSEVKNEFVEPIGISKRFLGLWNNEKADIIDTKSEKTLAENVSYVYISANGWNYIAIRHEDNKQVQVVDLSSLEKDLPRLSEIESYQDLLVDKEHHLNVLTRDDSVYAIINGDEFLPCNDYRISADSFGEPEGYPDISEDTYQSNIILAFYNDGGKEIIKMFPVRRKGVQSKLRLLVDSFNSIEFIHEAVFVIDCGGKQTFIHDKFGVLFPKIEGKELSINDVEWFEECQVVNTWDKGEKNFLVFKAVVNGEEKVVTPTNPDYLKWAAAM
jgi:hypothetical protein